MYIFLLPTETVIVAHPVLLWKEIQLKVSKNYRAFKFEITVGCDFIMKLVTCNF
jgi:hypothetical protein